MSMKKGIYILPNSITLCGMTCGIYAILQIVKYPNDPHRLELAAWAILLANIFDALDGWIARLTNSASRFGVQLDSLSDLLTFCAASSILVYSWELNTLGRYGWAASLFFVLCGAMRLARFNVQSESVESRSFTGMPTPAASTILTSGVLLSLNYWEAPLTPPRWIAYLALGLTFLLAFLMVSTVRYRSAKEILMRQRKPFWWLVLFAGIIYLLVIHPGPVLFLGSIVYLLSGLVEQAYRKIAKRPARPPAPHLPSPQK
jgi:CDP-diacylglycerol--serine O-phosphatidyltransferase